MPHHTPLIATIVIGLVVAFFMGAIAHRLRVSPVAGYLFAGVIVGPFTPGFRTVPYGDAAALREAMDETVVAVLLGAAIALIPRRTSPLVFAEDTVSP